VKEARPGRRALQKTIYRRDNEKGFYMTKKNKAVGCGDTQRAQLIIYGSDSTQIIVKLKATFFQVVTWLSVVVGSLC
jgi:hypothetical protein